MQAPLQIAVANSGAFDTGETRAIQNGCRADPTFDPLQIQRCLCASPPGCVVALAQSLKSTTCPIRCMWQVAVRV